MGRCGNKPGATALSSEDLKSTALKHTALIVPFSIVKEVQQHPSLLDCLLSLNLEIQDRTDVLEETCDLDLVDLATWFTPSVNQTPKPSDKPEARPSGVQRQPR